MNNHKNIINYFVMCVSEFAIKFKTEEKQAYNYLSQYGGIAFLTEHYEVEHTLSLDDAVEDMALVSRKNGGAL
ncbi:MAG: DUF3791 domain-containing protein [Lachnospiraceae bacterium]|nr:DUF3791 domain-containing protein [Lachnospiraceae bacterium]